MSKTAPVLNLLASVHSHATSCATSPAEPSRLGRTQAFVEHAGEDWQHILAVNLLGTMRVTQAILPRMLRAGRGRIVNMGSLAGKEGLATLAACSAASAGVIAFTKALSRELASRSVFVNCVAPGPIVTDMIRDLGTDAVNAMISDSPLLTRTSGSSGCGKRDNAASMAPESVTSTVSLDAPGTCVGFVSQIRTAAPLATSNSAIALPIPLAAPVITTDFPWRSYRFGMALLACDQRLLRYLAFDSIGGPKGTTTASVMRTPDGCRIVGRNCQCTASGERSIPRPTARALATGRKPAWMLGLRRKRTNLHEKYDYPILGVQLRHCDPVASGEAIRFVL